MQIDARLQATLCAKSHWLNGQAIMRDEAMKRFLTCVGSKRALRASIVCDLPISVSLVAEFGKE